MAWPTSPTFMAVDFESKEYNVQSESMTGRTQSRGLGGQRWQFTARYNNMSEADFLPIRAALMELRGSRNTTTIVLPKLSFDSALNTVSGSPVTNGAHTAGDNTITIDGFTGTFKAGELIKFLGYTKVYMITADLTGPGDLTIEPPIVEDISDGISVSRNNFAFTVRLRNDTQMFKLGIPNIYNFEVDFIEAL